MIFVVPLLLTSVPGRPLPRALPVRVHILCLAVVCLEPLPSFGNNRLPSVFMSRRYYLYTPHVWPLPLARTVRTDTYIIDLQMILRPLLRPPGRLGEYEYPATLILSLQMYFNFTVT